MKAALQAFSWILMCALGAISTTLPAREPSHGFSYFGDLKYPKNMDHFDYVNPDAPKGGTVKVSGIGTFNNLHSYVDKGIVSIYLDTLRGPVIYDPLMMNSQDELASYYGKLAETVEVADDYSWVEYTLRKNAYWHDGQPVTVEDVLWTFDVLKNEASVIWKSRYNDVVDLEQTGPWSFKFVFGQTAEKNPQLIILTASFIPLPKHYWKDRKFNATTLEPPLGNGPYRVGLVDPGHKLVLERVEDYWGKDLNVSRGHYNFDRIEVIYFFDLNVMLQALRAGVLDFYRDQNESTFATAYDFAGYRKGLFKRETYTMGSSYGMHYGVVFNNRRDLFKDIRVREALTLAYNFEWANRVYWHEGMDRNNSYFMRSGLQAVGMPSKAELELMEPFRGKIPDRVFTHPVPLPKNHPFGRNRDTLLRADELLRNAGWVVKDFKRVHEDTGEPFAFELVVSYVDHERMLTPFVDNLKRLGIEAMLRKVEGNLMVNRLRNYDYDTTMLKLYTYRVPFPARMRGQFTSRYAELPNMSNYAGVSDAAVDFLVEKIASATTEDEMNTAGRALDRVLLWSFYVIPDGHPVGRHLVYWDRFGHPPLGADHMNWTGFPYLWWFDEPKSARVDAGLAELGSN